MEDARKECRDCGAHTFRSQCGNCGSGDLLRVVAAEGENADSRRFARRPGRVAGNAPSVRRVRSGSVL